ncbi:copper amine oxidase N-terminal domain-containing protein [Paenibacillus pini]|uniref:Copper amine oxidase-like N-terminal domain-containing protein n=1 Tax=Paenibacillus pini JCM 16418 TaxID=1236976 RepID=W7YVW4_9BACL|nr:copper amine oxidase N-terminal domain-containing protein [Paenibacillus pini]GAF08766.1 hypothetical protein JCM16418_2871 [Paenibacillus pini JCM 16418]
MLQDKLWRYRFIGLMLMIMLFALWTEGVSVYADSPSIQISVDDKPLQAVSIQKNGTLFVPVNAIIEALGAEVVYHGDTKTIDTRYKQKSLSMRVGSREALSNGKKLTLTGAPFIQNSKVYVPLRAVSQSLGVEVEVNADQSINIQSAPMNLSVQMKLPIMNGVDKPFILEHDGSLRLKWWYQDSNPYEHYTGAVYPNKQLLIQGFNEGFVVDRDGKHLTDTMTTIRSYPLIVEAIPDRGGYTVRFDLDDKSYEWKEIPLYIGEMTLFPMIIAETYSYQGPIYLDIKGNLIVLTKDGLAAYAPSGERLWVRSSWVEKGRTWSPFDSRYYIKGDDSGRIYLCYEEGVLVLAADGSQLAAFPEWSWETTVLKDGSVLWNGGLYRWKDNALVHVTQPSGGGKKGDYVMGTNGGYLEKRSSSIHSKLLRYRLGQAERTRGFSLDADSLISDEVGHTFISTNGGTVHGLEKDGRLRFVLRSDNAYGIPAKIIPLSKEEVVILDGNVVLSLETVQKQK